MRINLLSPLPGLSQPISLPNFDTVTCAEMSYRCDLIQNSRSYSTIPTRDTGQ
jgi:hypothetical protein